MSSVLSEQIWGILAIVEIVYVVLLSAWIIEERRNPAATLAWILLLAALPIGGVVIYFFIGPRRLRRSRLKRLRAKENVKRPELEHDETLFSAETERQIAGQVSSIGARTIRASLSVARRWEILVDGKATFDALEKAIDEATHHVHALWYIFDPDQTGTRMRDALVRARGRGVEVRLLVDAVGSSRLTTKFLRPLREAGVEVAWFNRWRFAPSLRLQNFRNHRKILICDGQVGFTGGINVTDDENEGVNPAAYRDTQLLLEGPAVHWLQFVFLEDWHFATGRALRGPEYVLPDPSELKDGVPVQILDSGPDTAVATIKMAYFAAIGAAKKRVLLTTAYFVPDESMLQALQAAALRGVDVRVLVSRKSDSHFVMAAQRSYFSELVQNQVRVFEYMPRMLHAKSLVVDDWFASVGTSNYDNRSFRLNFEVVAVLYGAHVADALADIFENDLADALEVTSKRLAEVGRIAHLFESTARMFAPML